jgi:hypothetical protein
MGVVINLAEHREVRARDTALARCMSHHPAGAARRAKVLRERGDAGATGPVGELSAGRAPEGPLPG